MLTVQCRHCLAAAPRGAKFCPRCGREFAGAAGDVPGPAGGAASAPPSPGRKPAWEWVLGWAFLVIGLGLVLAALFAVDGWVRATFSGLIGSAFFVIGLGTLVGGQTPAAPDPPAGGSSKNNVEAADA